MKKLSLKSLKELKPVVLSDQDLKTIKGGDGDDGGDGIVVDDIAGF